LEDALSGTFFVVATPIGNLGDITFRAVETLKAVDLVVCEDTRVARRLLSHFGIQKRTISNFSGNEEKRLEEILDLLLNEKNVALTSDAGSPGISDPGFLLVRACREKGIPVACIPGPSALGAALSVCGLPSTRVLFLGFPPRKSGERSGLLNSLAADPATLVFYESPLRVRAFLCEIQSRLPGRDVSVLRELTKKFETAYRNPNPEDLPERGEYVLVVGPPSQVRSGGAVPEDAEAQVSLLVGQGYSEKDAMREIARRAGARRRDIYQSIKRREP
jgi:16S rRNA (cytidine1402-2'-O)-methyltransferase